MPLFKNSHWLFSAIDPQRGIIYIGDSLKWYGNDFIEEFKNLESAITKFIYGNKEKNWEYRNISNELPTQTDAFSCGPLACLNVDLLVRNQPFNYNIDDIIRKLRFNICICIILQDFSVFNQ